ncbi:hypothetical protein DFQ09_11161 [Winogradskyella pacifica]|uniref:Uncharacterized protein n=1 Tax=Winogradskyella pacifica TaxID=664642 RepID=A0A3D9LK18_9FLAO|nr:hypothetical protein DFQ09_11161 [Winogradskyella pacifica]
MNLFGTLTVNDKKIDLYINTIKSLLADLTDHINDISNKIECDNLEYDVFLIKK